VNGYRVESPAARRAGPRVIGFVKDVSEKIRADEDKRRLEAQLKQAEKMEAVGHLAGGIAHDFNNILGAILGYGELAQKRRPQGDLKRYLDTIMSAGNRAKSLVTQILSYSRAEGPSGFPVIVVPDRAGSVRPGERLEPAGHGVNFTALRRGSRGAGDPTRLHQLFMNLFTNAIQAMGQGGRLDVNIALEHVDAPRKVRTGELPAGEYVRLSVKDTGHGIAPEVIDRIFEPFFTTKPAGRGTGLGLALVHAVVKEHSGLHRRRERARPRHRIPHLAAAHEGRGRALEVDAAPTRARAGDPRGRR
jgi:signal transduction histidine kinase